MTRPVLRATLVGTSPLLMHSGSLLDPVHPVSVELESYHGKAAKSAADHARISDLEFLGALWHDDAGPCVPARTLLAALRQAAERRGVERRIRSALMIEADAPLDYDGPRSQDGLRADHDFRLRAPVTLDGCRRICTRPVFKAWAATVEVGFDAALIARSDLVDLLIAAGDDIGIGAGRPRFGRFAVVPAIPA